MDKHKAASYSVHRVVKEAKRHYRNKLESQFHQSGSRSLWQGQRTITDYRTPSSRTVNVDASLADELNTFYARFEAAAHSANGISSANSTIGSMHVENAGEENACIILEHDVRKAFRRVNTRKAAGPDGITGRILKACADQLAPVFTEIFNLSLEQNPYMLQTGGCNQRQREEYTTSVTSYIGKCLDDVSKTITTRSNQKPWMTAEVRALLKSRDSAFRAGDKVALRTARAKLSRAIREAKCAHAQRIHGHLQDSRDSRRMWQGIQAITTYKTTPSVCDSDASLPDALNDFYARIEAQNNVAARKTIPPPNDQVLCLSTADVRRTLCRVNPWKSAGPDNILGRVLRECAEQLVDVFTDIFNISLSSAVVPTCLKTMTIVPVLKKSTVSCFNDYRPIALTPIVMKYFERLIMRHIKTQLLPSLDPLQFAYHPNRSTDDAITTTLHLFLTQMDNKDTYVRMLFIDFSSAFNTIIPQQLIEKLSLLGLNTSLCNWILHFLTGRPQSIRSWNCFSSTTTLSTGAPQGCVLNPLLFSLLTHDCAAMHSSNHIIKFTDDTTAVGLISKNDKSAYREEVQRLTAWCRANNLSPNVDKTKEMVVDFRRAQSDHSPLFIDGSPVEIVKSTKFLGVHLVENFTWSLNTSSISKKAQQRPLLPAEAEESPSPSPHPDHVLQRDH
ncbi:hypothetical protein QTP70_031211 [Hemibagrus guttatus]|uniref:Reverse transcriptase domain-containing protein n=1 Tax=Hemibagrus guttatus TaxID=175788 RepID=A0AAE0UIL1_9TELE|nr:hypothetical protein QTP70_031211 [Hemibagrus guttatus]KAK3522598.1 hypothetical protein QTP86_027156 [Hemibagrus guttatus]